MDYNWILINKESGKYCMYHNAIEKPKYGNNVNESNTSSVFEWIEWNKSLPDDVDTVEYYYNSDTSEIEAV